MASRWPGGNMTTARVRNTSVEAQTPSVARVAALNLTRTYWLLVIGREARKEGSSGLREKNSGLPRLAAMAEMTIGTQRKVPASMRGTVNSTPPNERGTGP